MRYVRHFKCNAFAVLFRVAVECKNKAFLLGEFPFAIVNCVL